MFRKIVVADALALAERLARTCDGELIAVHAYPELEEPAEASTAVRA